VVRRLALERGRGSPEGCCGRKFGGPGLLGCGPFSALGRDHTECVLWFVGVFVYFYYFLGKWCFPLLLGYPRGCPRHLVHFFTVMKKNIHLKL
jgi:hypothetical protein